MAIDAINCVSTNKIMSIPLAAFVTLSVIRPYVQVCLIEWGWEFSLPTIVATYIV